MIGDYFTPLVLFCVVVSSPPPCSSSPTPRDNKNFFVVDPSKYIKNLGSDYGWAVRQIPFIDFPDNSEILTAYYYRWRLYRKHIKYTSDDGYVITEFLPDVPWAGKHNTIPAAAGHHIMEGRWLADQLVLNDYISFWFNDTSGSTPDSYTNWIGYAAWQRYLLNRNTTFIKTILGGLSQLYRSVYIPKYLKEVSGRPCWWQDDGRDAMEVSISGGGCRPTIASAMYGEAETLVKLGRLVGNFTLMNEFIRWQELSRKIVTDLHWNARLNTFSVVPIAQPDEHEFPSITESCDLSKVRILNKTAEVRELLGFMPWYYGSLLAHNATHFTPMFRQLFDSKGFRAPYGLRSAERRHLCYNYSYDHGDCWNGPSWPYETSRVLTGIANVLNQEGSPAGSTLGRDQYWELLLQYAKQHTITFAINDTAKVFGSGHVFENLHPDLGYWNDRAIMYWHNDPNKDMGNDYLHSSYIDLVLSGLLGIRPHEDGSLHINPLIQENTVNSFAVDHVVVGERKILSVVWDATGDTYKRYGQGLTVLLNGKVVQYRTTLGFLAVRI